MSLRTRHLACLFLLVSTLGASQASASRTRHGFYGDRISAILYRHAVDSHSEHLAQNIVATRGPLFISACSTPRKLRVAPSMPGIRPARHTQAARHP